MRLGAEAFPRSPRENYGAALGTAEECLGRFSRLKPYGRRHYNSAAEKV
jgi:hypothetical protein